MDERDSYWCDYCGTYEDDMVCPVLGPIQTMQDSEVQSRARASLPSGLAIQKTAEGHEGVFARVPLSKRMQFGPLEAPRVQAAPHGNKPFPLKVFSPDGSYLDLDTTDNEQCNWMKFVRPANKDTEQNLVAYQQGTNVFFLTQKDIPIGGEMLVWYAPNYAKKMDSHLLTPGGHLPRGGASPMTFTPDNECKTTAVEAEADKQSTSSTVCSTEEQHGTADEINTFAGQPESRELDVQQAEKMTHGKQQADPAEKSKADTVNSHQAGEGRGHRMLNKSCKRKALSLPNSGSVTTAKVVVTKKRRNDAETQILCAGCAETFKDEDVLKEHIEKEHPDEVERGRKRPRRSSVKCHFCQVCEDRFAKNSELLFHISTCHVDWQKRRQHRQRQVYSDKESRTEESDEEPAISAKRRKRNVADKNRAKKENHVEHTEQMWCSYCDVTFNSLSAGNRHGRTVHGFVTGTEKVFQIKDANLHCRYCSAPFCSLSKLSAHILTIHESVDKANYKCDTCQSNFPLPKDLQTHLKQAGSKCKIHCKNCDQSFTSLAAARVHQQQQHVVVKCQSCDKTFVNAGTLSRHVKGTHEQKEAPKAKDDAFWCSCCDQVFVQSSGFYKHQRNFHGLEDGVLSTDKQVYDCSLCQAPFTSERLLQSHLCKIHGLETEEATVGTCLKTSVCETCSEEFSGPAEHEAHLKRAEGRCVVKCGACEQSFDSLPSLRFHELKKHHTVECPQCQVKCANPSALGRHIKNQHSVNNRQGDCKPGLRWCKYCDLPFNSMDSLKRHMTEYHGTGLDSGTVDLEHCSLCNAPFTSRRSLLRHLQEVHKVFPDGALQVDSESVSPIHECETCCEKFPGPEQLQLHLEERKGECTVSCKQCGERFSSLPCQRLHEYHKHSTVKCKLCQETFVNASSLGKHVKKTHLKSEERKTTDSPKWCQYCDMNFARSESLTKHMKVYHGVGLSALDDVSATTDLQHCSLCDAPFTSMRSLQKHVQDVHHIYVDSVTTMSPSISKTHKCHTCHEMFQGPQQLQAHLTDRKGQCSMKCRECKAMFDSLPSLRLHEDKVHLSVKCELCMAKFTNASALGKHVKKMHSSEGKDVLGFNQRWCPYCDKTFTDTDSFTKHMKECHYSHNPSSLKEPEGVTDPLQHCHLCDAPYTSHKLLTKHVQEVHRLPASTGVNDSTEAHSQLSHQYETSSPQVSHQCETCYQKFPGPKHLDDHLRNGLGKCKLTCPQCKETFTRLCHLRLHQVEECGKKSKEAEGRQCGPLSEDSAFRDTESVIMAALEQQWCSYCDLTLSGESALSRHMKDWHGEGSAPGTTLVYCKACNSPIASEAKLLSHFQKLHKTSKSDRAGHMPSSVQCESCQKDFVSAQGLETHLLVRNRACHVDCKTCGLQFYSILRLRWHQCRTHTEAENGLHPGKDVLFCDICSTSFGTNESLSNHLSDHAGQDVYQCPVCGKAQPDKTILDHILAHVDELRQDLRCSDCSKTFDHIDAFLEHLQSHKLSKHKCPLCTSTVNNLEELKSHLENEHVETVHKHRCPMCTEVCQSVSNLGTHIKQCKAAVVRNFFSCELCKVRFSRKSALKNHQALQHSGTGEWLNCPHCEYRTKGGKGQLMKHFTEHDLLTELCEVWKGDSESITVTCTLCGARLPEKGLSYHLKKHDKVKYMFKCRLCPKEFFTHSQLQQHIANHIHRNGIMSCPLCDCPMKKSNVLCKHLKKVHRQALYQCPVCLKEIIYHKNFEGHLATHKGDIVLEARLDVMTSKCDICGKCFAKPTLVRRHKEQVHMNVRKFKCDVCNKDFKRKAECVVHMSVHSDDYPHLCMYCGKSFKVLASLNQHITIHLNIKKHVCHVCGKAFNQKVNMKKHLESHNKSREFQCDFCGKTFQHSDTLRMHVRLMHLDKGKFSCRFCGKKFLRESFRKVHEDGVHRGIRNKICQVCGQVMTYNHTLRRHFRRKHPNLFDKYFPASSIRKGISSQTSVDGSLNGSARPERKVGQKDHPATQEPALTQQHTMSSKDRPTHQDFEGEEMLSTMGNVVTDSGEHTLGANEDGHTTFIIITDQNSTEQSCITSSAQLAESGATITTTTQPWVPRQFQGDTVTVASSCEILVPTETYMQEQSNYSSAEL